MGACTLVTSAVVDLPPPPPDDALAWLLPPDVDLDAGWRHPAARPVWHGVVWSRLGRADLAFAHFDRVALPALQPWIAAERGRVLRELGLHAAAEALGWPALRAADDPDDAAMLRVSLVADAVGRADPDRATRRLAAARAAVHALAGAPGASDPPGVGTDTRAASDPCAGGSGPDGIPAGPRAARQRLRLCWVEVEVAWLEGRAPPTAGLARWDEVAGAPALADDHRHGSAFHTAKGLLFGGLVADDDRLLSAAAELAPPALLWAIELARAERGEPGALDRAREAWATIVAPPHLAAEVASTATARRLSRR